MFLVPGSWFVQYKQSLGSPGYKLSIHYLLIVCVGGGGGGTCSYCWGSKSGL